MRLPSRALVCGLLAVLALSLAACGSSKGLLSGQQAASLSSSLSQVRAALDQHNCTAARSEAASLKSQVQQLPSSVNGTVRRSLEQGVSTVERLIAQDCTATPATTPTQTTPTQTTTTTITTTAKPPPTTPKTTPSTPATTPTQTGTTTGPASPSPPGKGKGKGHGPGQGNGPGGGDPPPTTTPTTPTNP